ncbi:2-oxoacid:ferredoxin oxidoreductase subunit beta [bacterium]|nr:2-oxoacid:ferredoxin oxidoreductase subunit beta [bacterium]
MEITTEKIQLKKQDFESDQEVRWCPGCGDYSILATVQRFLPSLGIEPHNIVFVSGIGCSSRFPYYMNTYGFHTIHGRAPAIATGLKVTRPDLNVWMVTGDGDALSIGGNHFIHILRRNPNIKILLFNNRIYGLTKGQYSPTSELGKVTKSTPQGSSDYPLNPVLTALGAQATFIARSIDRDSQHLTEIFKAATDHQGAALIEIYQNCNIFNDGAFDNFVEREVKEEKQLRLMHGKPMVFGKEKNKGIAIENFKARLVTFEAGQELEAGVSIYDAHNHALAALIARLPFPEFPMPIGIFYQEKRPAFEALIDLRPPAGNADENLKKLFNSGDTWTVS